MKKDKKKLIQNALTVMIFLAGWSFGTLLLSMTAKFFRSTVSYVAHYFQVPHSALHILRPHVNKTYVWSFHGEFLKKKFSICFKSIPLLLFLFWQVDALWSFWCSLRPSTAVRWATFDRSVSMRWNQEVNLLVQNRSSLFMFE